MAEMEAKLQPVVFRRLGYCTHSVDLNVCFYVRTNVTFIIIFLLYLNHMVIITTFLEGYGVQISMAIIKWCFVFPILILRKFLLYSVKILRGYLIETTLNLCILVNRMSIVTILDLAIHEHERSFRLLLTSSISSILQCFLWGGVSHP